MLNLIKNFYRSHRLSKTPGKTLLWIWLKKDLSNVRGHLGIDLAGGSMANKRFFLVKNYICVDIDQKKLDSGKNKYPDAVAINSKIQDFMKNENNKKPDVLVCVQTMGTNLLFEHNETLKVIELMYNYLNHGGTMIFNIGSSVKNLNKIEKQISEFYIKKLVKIKSKMYGALHDSNSRKIHPILRILIAYVMHIIPPIRTLFGLKRKKLYFIFKNKI